MADSHSSFHSTVESSESRGAVARRLIESISTHALFQLDSNGDIVTWPAPAEELYRHDAESVLGEHVSSLFADKDSGDPDSLDDGFFEQPKAETVEIERWHQRADDAIFWGTLTLSPLWNGTFHGYAAVCQDRTASKEYERMLERQNDRLKEFTDILAHDLRNPLSAIDGHLNLYEETGDGDHLEKIDETTDRMARLVDDLLRVARQGNVVTDPEPTDIGDIIEVAWECMASDSGQTLQYNTVGSVSSDPDRLCELFENLFRNAVEHGEGRLTVRVGPLNTGFYVEDDGPGIADEDKNEVFDHGFTTRDDGHGYGLSVVRTIVNAHGWDITASDAQDGGARFEVTGIEFLD